jgi:hypothetical protein
MPRMMRESMVWYLGELHGLILCVVIWGSARNYEKKSGTVPFNLLHIILHFHDSLSVGAPFNVLDLHGPLFCTIKFPYN